jgi:transcriptional regulator with XRE-family HTH domain
MTNTMDLSRLARELARWRQEANLSQSALAKLIGVHVTYIQKLESETPKSNRRPAMEMVAHIVAVLDQARIEAGLIDESDRIDMNYAFRLAGYPEVATPIQWASLLQELNSIPTTEIDSASKIEGIARRISAKYQQRNVDVEATQNKGSHRRHPKDHSKATTAKKGAHKT